MWENCWIHKLKDKKVSETFKGKKHFIRNYYQKDCILKNNVIIMIFLHYKEMCLKYVYYSFIHILFLTIEGTFSFITSNYIIE